MDEPKYVDPDDPYSDHVKRRPKWMTPKHALAKRILFAVHRKYYRTQEEREEVNDIVRKSLSLRETMSPYPTEWIETLCQWSEKMWAETPIKPVSLQGLIGVIKNEDRMMEFVGKWAKENGKSVSVDRQDTDYY